MEMTVFSAALNLDFNFVSRSFRVLIHSAAFFNSKRSSTFCLFTLFEDILLSRKDFNGYSLSALRSELLMSKKKRKCPDLMYLPPDQM
jgi:hypothetical protein